MIRVVVISLLALWSALPSLAQTYFHDLDQSLAAAKNSDKEVLMIFSGSDWCKPCIQLKKSILDSPDFQSYSTDKIVLLELDFPYSRKKKLPKAQKEHNDALADKYNQDGQFPKMLLLSNNQEVIGEITYSKSSAPATIIKQIQNLTK